MSWLKDRIKNWLEIADSNPSSVNIQEAFGYETTVFRNRLWYRGDPTELHQFFTSIDDLMNNTSFWAARGTTGINFRKIHSGLPALIVDVLVDIVLSDLNDIKVKNTEAQKRWDDIAKENKFKELLKKAVRETLIVGDGAFKISVDSDISKFPIVEFYGGERVNYMYKRGRLQAVNFLTDLTNKTHKKFHLEETYSEEGVSYKVFNHSGEEEELRDFPELADLKPVQNQSKFLLAVQFLLDDSPKYGGRGKSLFDSKSGTFDAFDECVSQWVEALRDGRTTKYIPQNLVPKNPDTGVVLRPNPFDNRYIMTGAELVEGAESKITSISGEIPTEGLLGAYMTILDLCLQGLVSPSTLGIDVKKLDNADAQREKEKATLYTRDKIVSKLEETLPKLVETVLKVDDMVNSRAPGEYEVTISFGEYANPSFEAQVETLAKAKTAGIMSVERIVDELYGDSMSDDDKAAEVQRLKDEQGVVAMPIPSMDGELDVT